MSNHTLRQLYDISKSRNKKLNKEQFKKKLENYNYYNLDNKNKLVTLCLCAREYLSSQSTTIEDFIKEQLLIEDKLNETSGDGHKNGDNYEFKVSVHGKEQKFNFVQIRPRHNIDYYIFITYNIYNNDDLGEAHIFKIPSENLYNLLPEYGGYAHGTMELQGEITNESIYNNEYEYALRVDRGIKKKDSKAHKLWNELLKYEVTFKCQDF